MLSLLARLFVVWACIAALLSPIKGAAAQPLLTAAGAAGEVPAEPDDAQIPITPDRIDVAPGPGDEQIAKRLEGILRATDWFENAKARVDEGVVFLSGKTPEENYRKWAGDLARRTEGVVAVVNRIEVVAPPLGDWAPVVSGLLSLWEGLLEATPFLTVGLLILIFAYVAGRATAAGLRSSFRRRGELNVLRDVTARAVGFAAFTFGLYIALRVAGLTRLAATVLGGTGVLGLVLGVAFRNIAENTLASILLTRQRPFKKGDLVEIQGIEGFVQQLTLRATVLMTLDGNHVQIPNATVYTTAIRNFTSNPARRIDFVVGVGYSEAIARAQEIALEVVSAHPAVLADPEPWVLADNLGSASVQLRVYVWLDSTRHSWLKVRSSVIRLVKRAFQEQGISMPDEAREVVFPESVPVRLLDERTESSEPRRATPQKPERLPTPHAEEPSEVSTQAEAGLDSEGPRIQRLASETRTPEEGQDLLEDGGNLRSSGPGRA